MSDRRSCSITAGGGKYEEVVDCLSCRDLPDEGDYHKLSFQIRGRGIHLNAFPDGQYRIMPTLRGMWSRANPVAAVFLGYRTIEPKSASVVLKKDHHIQSLEFELVQRLRPWGTILSAAVGKAIVGSVLQRGKPSKSLAR
jgi:hypothetical protein